MSFSTRNRRLRPLMAALVLATLVLGAVPAAACADGDDCGMVAAVTVPTAGCGGDSCPLAAAVATPTGPAGSPGPADDGSVACCAGPELDAQAPALLSTERSEDPTAPAVGPVSARATLPVAPPAPRTSRDRPPRPDGGGTVALHRLLAIDLC